MFLPLWYFWPLRASEHVHHAGEILTEWVGSSLVTWDFPHSYSECFFDVREVLTTPQRFFFPFKVKAWTLCAGLLQVLGYCRWLVWLTLTALNETVFTRASVIRPSPNPWHQEILLLLVKTFSRRLLWNGVINPAVRSTQRSLPAGRFGFQNGGSKNCGEEPGLC